MGLEVGIQLKMEQLEALESEYTKLDEKPIKTASDIARIKEIKTETAELYREIEILKYKTNKGEKMSTETKTPMLDALEGQVNEELRRMKKISSGLAQEIHELKSYYASMIGRKNANKMIDKLSKEKLIVDTYIGELRKDLKTIEGAKNNATYIHNQDMSFNQANKDTITINDKTQYERVKETLEKKYRPRGNSVGEVDNSMQELRDNARKISNGINVTESKTTSHKPSFPVDTSDPSKKEELRERKAEQQVPEKKPSVEEQLKKINKQLTEKEVALKEIKEGIAPKMSADSKLNSHANGDSAIRNDNLKSSLERQILDLRNEKLKLESQIKSNNGTLTDIDRTAAQGKSVETPKRLTDQGVKQAGPGAKKTEIEIKINEKPTLLKAMNGVVKKVK